MTDQIASLYGIRNSNRRDDAHWTKNCFNSSFPASLACWMRDNEKDAVYVNLDNEHQISNGYISISDVFNTEKPNSEIFFEFESSFSEYQQFAYDAVTGIDIIINVDGLQVRPLEVKLTVVPDSTTANEDESLWGPEIVVRPASTQFCALGMVYANKERKDEIRDIFDPVCSTVQHWDNKTEMLAKYEQIVECLDSFHEAFSSTQQPFLLQPLWKTQGKTAALAEPAFDLFVWSDHALCKAFTDNAGKNFNGTKINRQSRAVLRLARVLWEISRGSRTNLASVFTEMAFELQTDKEFSFSGKIIRQYLTNTERHSPRMQQSVLREIILNGGHELLSPERRFDASIFYSAANLFRNSEIVGNED